MKRVVLFLLTNLAVMLVLSVVTSLLGVNKFLTANGLNVGMLFVFAAVIGFGGAFISLLMSKTMAKWSTGAQVITQPSSSTEVWLVDTVERLSRKDWDSVLAVNLTGATMMAQEVLAHMLERDVTGGVIINISSIARHGSRGQSNYVAAKAALAANTQTWMREFSRYGIRVGAIAPGLIETPMTAGMNEKALERLRASVPLGRIGKPEDIFVAVKFIIECDFFTGQTIDVDGGGAMG